MISRIQFPIVVAVLLVAIGSFGQNAFSQDSKSVDLRALEKDLTTTLEQITDARKSGQPTSKLEKRLDGAFMKWSLRVAPAAQHSVGWPNAEAKAKMQKRVSAVQVRLARIESFRRLLLANHDGDSLVSAQTKSYCQLLAGMIKQEVVGLPANETKMLDKFFGVVESPVAFARATVMVHLNLSKYQVGNRRVLIDEINRVIEQVQKLDRDQPNDVATRKQLSEAINKVMVRDCTMRSLEMSSVVQKRTVLASLAKTGPHFRAYLISRQVHRIAKRQVDLAERNNLNVAVVDARRARTNLASELEEEFLRRCGDPFDRKLKKVIREMCLQQDEIRGLQESIDAKCYAAKTYTIESLTVASEHLKRASRLLNATGDSDLAKQLDGVVGKLADRK